MFNPEDLIQSISPKINKYKYERNFSRKEFNKNGHDCNQNKEPK